MLSNLLEPNPILVRELRARFRHWGAFGLFFGYAALLAVAMAWRYGDAAGTMALGKNPLVRMSALGHELFLTMTWMQALVWTLIAPSLTASGIAREREDGLLEGVLLAPLSPAKIVAGKLLSALSVIALLILVSLPISAVCFLMGGVSPEEFRAAILLHASTAFFGATVGLACSAWSRRANIALRSAYALIIVWLIGSGLSLAVISVPGWLKARAWEQFLYSAFAWSNPILAAFAIAGPEAAGLGATPGGLFADAPWAISVVLQVSFACLLLLLSTFALRRPFEARDESQLKLMQQSVMVPAALSPTADESTFGEMINNAPRRAEWMEIPGTSQLRFSNPVLQREARGKFRMKPPTVWLLIFELLLALGVAYMYLLTFWTAITKPNERDTIWWVIAFIGLFIVGLAATVMGASAFTREREGKTWEPLRLSQLSPAEILDAKLGACLLAFLVYSVPFWPILLPCVRPVLPVEPYSAKGVSLFQAINTFGVLAATAWCYALWGMWCSWRCRRTVTSVGWALGSLFLVLIFVPSFGVIAMRGGEDWLWIYHPFVTLGFVTDGGNGAEVFSPVGWGGVLFLTVCGLFIRRKLHSEMRDLPETARSKS